MLRLSRSFAVPLAAVALALVPAAPALAASAHPHRGSGTSAAVILLAVLGGLLALAVATWGLARWRGWEPEWAQTLVHTFSEAGFRAEATWAEFTDWVRLGR